MRNLEHRARDRSSCVDDPRFGGRLDVAGEEDAHATVYQPNHERAVVRVDTGDRAGMKNLGDRGAERDRRAVARQHTPAGSGRVERALETREAGSGARRPVRPELARRELLGERREPTVVIELRVRHHQRAESKDLSRMEERRDEPLPGIEAARKAAAVDDDHTAAGQLDDRGVALPDREKGRTQARVRIAFPSPVPAVDDRDDREDRDQ